MKKIILFILGFIILLPNMVYAKINEILVSSETKYYKTTYNNLIEMNNLTNEGMTIEISEKEYNRVGGIELFANTETEYKKLTTNIYKSGTAYRYEAALNWKKMPKARSYDIIGIGFYESVAVDGGLSFSQKYCISSTYCKTSTGFVGSTWKNGASAVFKLPTESIISLTETLSFKVKKAGNYTIVDQIAAGDYSHAQSSITQALAKEHSVNDSKGIVLSSSAAAKFDAINPAIAKWNGTW